ncbi:DUF4041 domain-containing protein [Nitratireductor aquimarinus]|uniref:DUF4041 domain-containing protein n=1 Tax=Nitratireductor aquimarinus TaxID=889300 RepID=A0ABU4AL33_9HYPH|nr:DUF4041 domain-containing protein [Nitratireductor aquimarinus]MDV6226963.1 DUF4041 domain-containing protein [Nitratireductor aquimarinus]
MDQQYFTIIGGLALLASPILFAFFAFLYWRTRGRLAKATSDLTELEEKYGKMEAGTRKLLSVKKLLDQRLADMEERFRPVVDLDAECAAVSSNIAALTEQLTRLRASYAEKRATYDRLVKEVAIFDERLAFAELGVYEPHFDFTDSEEFKRAITQTREAQKRMVSDKTAVICTTNWTVDGSTAKGQTMTNRAIRLTLRAFNNECEAAIANTRWNNVNAMEKRIHRAYEQIEKLNQSNSIEITPDYLKLKLQELHLTHEYREKLKSEREERAEMARAQREERKLQRDLERAEEEEVRYQKMVNKAKAEAEGIVGPQLDVFNERIRTLERDLAEAHAKVERAQAMAEKTRSGYVYIISNVGSFGENVVKIGLTRRLDPTDRVRELGDASVPFVFDTHAIIYSDDAPALERALHNEFEAVRINAKNYRKEFFRATISDVETAVKRLAPDAPFFRDVEAQEYRETLAQRKALLTAAAIAEKTQFPDSI